MIWNPLKCILNFQILELTIRTSRLNSKISAFWPTNCIYVIVWFLEQRTIIPTHSINIMDFIMETWYVYCAVPADPSVTLQTQPLIAKTRVRF
jgi:hypothetical protein